MPAIALNFLCEPQIEESDIYNSLIFTTMSVYEVCLGCHVIKN